MPLRSDVLSPLSKKRRLAAISSEKKIAILSYFVNGGFWRKAAVRRNVRCWVTNGKHMLALMFSAVDLTRTSRSLLRNENA